MVENQKKTCQRNKLKRKIYLHVGEKEETLYSEDEKKRERNKKTTKRERIE